MADGPRVVRTRHDLVLVEPLERPSVAIELADPARRMATAYLLAEAGWSRSHDPDTADVVVTDRFTPSPGEARVVLVIRVEPISCRRAVDALTAGHVHAIVDAGRPEQLPVALDQLHGGVGSAPTCVLTMARSFPTLRPRLEHVLDLVLRGHPNQAIARTVGASEATTKRDIAELLRLFDAPNRLALAAIAARLGHRPDPDRPSPADG